MKQTELTEAIDKVIELKLKAADRLIEELIEPLADLGSPEDLIGKPFESWTPEELAMLVKIYGREEPNLLSNLIFRKTYDRVKALEQEEAG